MRLFTYIVSAATFTYAVTPYDDYVLAPSSRWLKPSSVFRINGTVSNANCLLSDSKSASFAGASAASFDFGKNVAGLVSFNVDHLSSLGQEIGVTFSKSSEFVFSGSSDATADAGLDAPLLFNITKPGYYAASSEYTRGGFRYLSITNHGSDIAQTVSLSNLTVYFDAYPQVSSPAEAYTGYFHCSDELLNRVWYAGAYTNQLCTIDPKKGNALVHYPNITKYDNITGVDTWYNNDTIANGTAILTDGAKRDRLIWPGDLAISGATTQLSTGDLTAISNDLDNLFSYQAESGALPWAGTPIANDLAKGVFSFTYHAYTLIGVANYFQYSGDVEYVRVKWDRIKRAIAYSTSFIDSSGLQNVSSSSYDWLRDGLGGHNIEANAILYHTLLLAIGLAGAVDDKTVIPQWTIYATNIKAAANAKLWDEKEKLYFDNETTTLHPQDGNAWAVLSGLATPDRAAGISTSLAARWGRYGAPAPGAGETVSPFISGFELQAHVAANRTERALALMRSMWGEFMLDDPRMTNSTFIEGYSTDGALHYSAYSNDARISHAHGWSTGPTGVLTQFVAGITLTGPAGKTWSFQPRPGDLRFVEAGFKTGLGEFSANLTREEGVRGWKYVFSAPKGTSGVLSVFEECCEGEVSLFKRDGGVAKKIAVQKGVGYADGLGGGDWTAELKC